MNLAPTIKSILYSHEEKEIDLYVNAYDSTLANYAAKAS